MSTMVTLAGSVSSSGGFNTSSIAIPFPCVITGILAHLACGVGGIERPYAALTWTLMPSTAVASPSGEGFLWWGEFDYFFDTTVGRTPSGVNQFVPCAFPVPRVGTQVYLSLSGNTSHFMVLLYLLRK